MFKTIQTIISSLIITGLLYVIFMLGFAWIIGEGLIESFKNSPYQTAVALIIVFGIISIIKTLKK